MSFGHAKGTAVVNKSVMKIFRVLFSCLLTGAILVFFPEDLKFQSTSDRTNFQGRYIIRHPFVQEDSAKQYCSDIPGSYRRAYLKYQLELSRRRKINAQTLADLTGWNIQEIRQKIAEYNSK